MELTNIGDLLSINDDLYREDQYGTVYHRTNFIFFLRQEPILILAQSTILKIIILFEDRGKKKYEIDHSAWKRSKCTFFFFSGHAYKVFYQKKLPLLWDKAKRNLYFIKKYRNYVIFSHYSGCSAARFGYTIVWAV